MPLSVFCFFPNAEEDPLNSFFRGSVLLKTILISAVVLLCIFSVISFVYCAIQDRKEAEQGKKQ